LRDVETERRAEDVGIKQAIDEEHSRTENLRITRAISTTGGYNLEGYAPELDMPKGRTDDGQCRRERRRASSSITGGTG